jgi:hypothetical protein
VRGYRCYVMSGERIQALQILECADDADVISRGTALLSSKPEHQRIEIWNGGQMVAHVPRPEQSESEVDASTG